MKPILFILMAFVFSFRDTNVSGGQAIEYVGPELWLANVNFVRQHNGVTFLTEYDPVLLRQYFTRYLPTEDKNDLWPEGNFHWKLWGLLTYGNLSDTGAVHKLAQRLSSMEWECTLVIPARHGDVDAMKSLLKCKTSNTTGFLRIINSKQARDRLVEIANDHLWDSSDRMASIAYLTEMGDARSLQVFLSEDFEKLITTSVEGSNYRNEFQGFFKVQLPKEVKTPEEIRQWVKKNPVSIVAITPAKCISVKGGIDWSKVDFTKSPPEYKPSEIHGKSPQPTK